MALLQGKRPKTYWVDHARPAHKRQYQTTRAVGRFIAGRDLDGQRRTDARWNKPGTQPLTATGHASRWAHYPHRKRANIRIKTTLLVLGLAIGAVLNWGYTASTLRVLAWVGIGLVCWATWEKSRRYVHRKEVIAPLGEFLASRLGDSRYMLDPRSYVHVPVDVNDGPSRVYLPSEWTPASPNAEKTLALGTARKIGLRGPSYTFELAGDSPYFEIRPAPDPPELVSFAKPEIRALVENREPGVLFLGLGPRDAPQYLDLVKGAPHIGWSMATNAGKSTAARGGIMQFLHDGGICLILDPKMDSHPWARGLPNVRYCDTPKEIFDGLTWLSGEVDRRNAIGKKHGDIWGNVDPRLVGPKLLVIAEELNSMEIDQAAYWRSIRQPGQPLKSESMTALGRALNMGRAKRVYIFPIAQELLVQSLGGPAAKANLSTLVLGRANTPTWNKLAPQCKVNGRYPKKSMWPGRVYLVITDEPIPVQTMLVDEQDARDYAMAGIVSIFPGNDPGDHVSAFPYAHGAADLGHPGETQPGDPAGDPGGDPASRPLRAVGELVTLADAAERFALTIDTLRNASKRDERFPSPVEASPGKPSKYDLAAVTKYLELTGRNVGSGAA